jgi:predicted nuclease of predicted toxin-antitoxin system
LADQLRFLIDQCVPDGVGKHLRDSGHDVLLLREVLDTRAPDQVVAAQAVHDDRILVSVDSDFKKMRNRLSINAQRFKTMAIVMFTCGQVAASSRVVTALPYILFAWGQQSGRQAKPLKIEVQGAAIRILD